MNAKKHPRKKWNPKRHNPILRLISLLSLVAMVIFILQIVHLGILPVRFEIPILGSVLLLTLIIFLFYNFTSRSRLSRFISGLLVIALTFGYGLGSYYIYRTDSAISSVTDLSNKVINNVSFVVMKESSIKKLSQASGAKVGITPSIDSKAMKEALADVESSISIDTVKYTSYLDEVQALYDGDIDAMLLSESYRGTIYDQEAYQDFNQRTRTVHTTHYTTNRKKAIQQSTDAVDVTQEPFTIYVSGNDSFGTIQENSRTDSNMLITVNPTTHTILMTSIPRDYYEPIVCSADSDSDCPDGENDKLTHSGIYGISTSEQTIENFMDVDINYYVRVNFSSLVNIVDAVGGVDVKVGKGLAVKQFYTDHTVGGVHEGTNHLNGQKALAYARERYSYTNGDMQRVKNQQQVLKALLKKVKSPSMIMNYGNLIDALGGAFETNLSSDDIRDFVRMQLLLNSNWKFESYAMIGTPDTRMSASMGTYASVTLPNKNSITTARKKIEAVINGKSSKTVKDTAKQEDTTSESTSTEEYSTDTYSSYGQGYYDYGQSIPSYSDSSQVQEDSSYSQQTDDATVVDPNEYQ